MVSRTGSEAPFMAIARTAASSPRSTSCTSRRSSFTMSSNVTIWARISTARSGSSRSRPSSTDRSVPASVRLMISSSGWMPPTTLEACWDTAAPPRSLRVSATIPIASGAPDPMVAMLSATSARSEPGSPDITAEALRGLRWARTRAMVCGSSPSIRARICTGSMSSRNSKDLPAMLTVRRFMSPAAFSEPKDASSRPSASSRPPGPGAGWSARPGGSPS